MKKKYYWIIGIIVIVIILSVLTNFTADINNQISIVFFDKSCKTDSDCNLISPGCPGTCLPCDAVICAKGSWKDRFCPLPTFYEVKCAPCPFKNITTACKCINNKCEKMIS